MLREKSKRDIRLLSLGLAVLLLVSIFPCVFSALAAKDGIQTVRVGFFEMDGYHEMSEDGTRSGYGYDFLQLVSRYTDINFEYVGYDKGWDDMLDMLLDGKIDMVTSARKTSDREKKYLFSSEPIGSNTVRLNVRVDEDRFNGTNFKDYNGMTIGLLSGNSRNVDVDAFARQKGFTYRVKYFSTSSELAEALQNGDVDAVATSSLRKTSDERTINEFGDDNFYVIVNRNNPELLEQVDFAISQMDLHEGDWRYELNEKYYRSQINSLIFSTQERAVIEDYSFGGNVLKIAANPIHRPYSYSQGGKMKGIIPDIFEEVISKSGMRYEYIVTGSIEEYMKLLSDRGADVFLDSVSDASTQESRGFLVSDPYMSMNVAKVTRTDFSGNVKKAGFVVWQKYTGQIDVGDAEIVTFETFPELISAVKNKKIDVAYLHLYVAQQLVNSIGNGSLTYSTLDEPKYNVRFAIRNDLPHAVCSILNKCLKTFTEERLYEIVSSYTDYSVEEMGFGSWLALHPEAIAIISALVMLILGVMAYLILRTRYERKHGLEMAEASEAAQTASRAKTTFLFNMSHDIRTPMNAIAGYTAMAKRHLGNKEEVRDYLEKIEISGNQLLSLINQVLEMSRIESGKITLNEEPADIIERAHAMQTMAAADIESKNLDYSLVIQDVVHKDVLVDVSQMNRVFTNIISNAVKYTKEGGRIQYILKEIPCDKPGYGLYEISVSDSGIGMSEEFMGHIFDAFARERNSTTSGVQGTGLGMSIVKNLVELMSGTIDIQSKQGVGTTVTITVPMKLNENAVVSEEAESPNLGSIKERHILLVEDNEMNREIAKDILEEYGAIVDEAENGAVAVEKVYQSDPGTYDAILMDIQMPVMDGYEATKVIRSATNQDVANIPIIALSANAFEEDRKKSLEAGMDDHVAKPIDIHILKETLSKYL